MEFSPPANPTRGGTSRLYLSSKISPFFYSGIACQRRMCNLPSDSARVAGGDDFCEPPLEGLEVIAGDLLKTRHAAAHSPSNWSRSTSWKKDWMLLLQQWVTGTCFIYMFTLPHHVPTYLIFTHRLCSKKVLTQRMHINQSSLKAL